MNIVLHRKIREKLNEVVDVSGVDAIFAGAKVVLLAHELSYFVL
jgi:2-keto-3-deoxy-L-rhamnonate aldolase RhmA